MTSLVNMESAWSIIVVALLVGSVAQVDGKILVGGCQTPSTQQNFSAALYMGRWYEQQRYASYAEIMSSCATAYHTYRSLTSFDVQRSENTWSGSTSSITATATRSGSESDGKYSLYYPSNGQSNTYWVVATDYTSYAVVYSCRDYFFFSDQMLRIYTRDKNAGVNTIANARAIASARGLKTFPLRSISQNC